MRDLDEVSLRLWSPEVPTAFLNVRKKNVDVSFDELVARQVMICSSPGILFGVGYGAFSRVSFDHRPSHKERGLR